MSRIANAACRSLVKACVPFKCHGSMFAKWESASDGTRMYVVYSYGEHWPLFVCHEGTWYENSGRYSVTTSKHRSQSHPHCDTILATCDELKAFIRRGLEACPKIERLVAVSVG